MNKDTLQYIKDRANEEGSIKAVSCADVRDLIAELEATRASLEMANNSVKHLHATRAGTKAALDTWIETGISEAAKQAELLAALKDTTASLALYLFQEGGTDKLRESRTLFNARAAIAKAEGE